MEKKTSSRTSSSSTSDLKKQQDASVNKNWPKAGKKRESTTNSSRSDNTKKQPPRTNSKAFDKRPKPRGYSHGAAYGGKLEPGLDDEEPEVGSLFVPGSKKQNLNHLLNFNYTPRNVEGPRAPNRKGKGLVSSSVHKHSKELFLQSNCQFIVSSSGNYVPHMTDPDIPVAWENIEQINVRITDYLNCPICLCEVVAGKITRCGHAFCWPCLLHYFALSESNTRPCPICFQPINKNNVKSVQGVWQDVFPVGKEICMRLMRRLRSNMLVEPAPHQMSPFGLKNKNTENFLSFSEKSQSTLFSKILIASQDEVMGIINRERKELNEELKALAADPEFCFVNEALNLLQQRESAMNAMHSNDNNTNEKLIDNPIENQYEENLTVLENIKISETEQSNNVEYENFKSLLNPDAPVFALNSITEESSKPNIAKSDDQEKYFYFYQANDGQTMFLDGLDIRILEASWGGLNFAPREIRGVILQRASGSVSTDSRRRLKFLQHLPIHCPYDMIEIQLEPPYVSMETLEMFKDDLDDRKRQRQRRARDEKRREKLISQRDRQLMGYAPTMNININSEKHFPAYQPDFDNSLSSTDTTWDKEDVSSSPDIPWGQSQSTMSFAKMASTSGNWSVRASSSSASALTMPQASTSRSRFDSDCSDDAAAPPSYNVSLSEAIAVAMSAQFNEQTSGSNKKKKKQKSKMLFSTGIQHRTATD